MTNEQIGEAIAIHIGNRRRAPASNADFTKIPWYQFEPGRTGTAGIAIEQQDTTGLPDDQIKISVGIKISQCRDDMTRARRGDRLSRVGDPQRRIACPVIHQHQQILIPGADHQVKISVAIQIYGVSSWDIHPDGTRALLIEGGRGELDPVTSLDVILHWTVQARARLGR